MRLLLFGRQSQKERGGKFPPCLPRREEPRLSLSHLDVQLEAAMWNREGTSKIAHKMSADFIQWLISQANEGNWSKEEVGSIVCRKNADNQLILATLDKETQRKVAVFNKDKTCLAVPHMEQDFLQWLHQEATEGRWKQKMVYVAVVKKELNGKAHFSAKIKPGIVRRTMYIVHIYV